MKANHFLLIILVATITAAPLWLSPYHLSFFVTMFMSIALAESWNLFSGMTGYISLGHGLFFGIGAYAFAVVTAIFGLAPAVGLVLGAAVPALVALVLGLVLLSARMRVAYFAIIMLGFNEITKTIIANVKAVGSSYGLTLPPLANRFFAYYFLFALAMATTCFAFAVHKSRWGYGLKAIVADETAAATAGVGIVAHKLAMFVASAVCIGLTGAVIAWNWSYVDPYMAFDLATSFNMVVMAVFGGFGTVFGPVLGGVVMSLVGEVLSTNLPQFHTIIFGVLVIVLIIWCPGGIIQAFDIVRRKWAQRARTGVSGAMQ